MGGGDDVCDPSNKFVPDGASPTSASRSRGEAGHDFGGGRGDADDAFDSSGADSFSSYSSGSDVDGEEDYLDEDSGRDEVRPGGVPVELYSARDPD